MKVLREEVTSLGNVVLTPFVVARVVIEVVLRVEAAQLNFPFEQVVFFPDTLQNPHRLILYASARLKSAAVIF